jgi:hypothetical protein
MDSAYWNLKCIPLSEDVLRRHVQHQTLDPLLVTLPKLNSECANQRQSARRPCSL